MSLIVVIREKDRVVVGADTQITSGDAYMRCSNVNNIKIWNVKDKNIIFGHCGLKRDADIVRLINDFDYDGDLTFEVVVHVILPRIKKELEDYSYRIFDEDGHLRFDSRYIIASKNNAFVIESNGCVLEVEDCLAVGNGEDEAILLLDFNKDKKSEDRIIETIKAVSNRNIYVGSDVVIKDTLDSTKTKFIK